MIIEAHRLPMNGTMILTRISETRTSLSPIRGRARLFHVNEMRNVNCGVSRMNGLRQVRLTMIR